MLLLCALIVGKCAWADDTYEYTNTPALNTSNYFTVEKNGGSASTFNVNIEVTLANETKSTVTKAVKMEGNTTISFTTTRTADVYVGLYDRNGTSANSANNQFKIDDTAYTATNSTDAGTYEIVTVTNLAAGNHVIKQNGKEVEVYYVKVVEKGANTSPVLTLGASSATVKATEAGVAATTDISVVGTNLTGSTLSATLSPAVDGLSVSLNPTTISSGSISSTATISYSSNVNVKGGTTTLTISDGTTSKTATINYSALVVPFTMQSISTSTTFQLKDTGEGLQTVTPDEYVLLANAGSEASFAENIAVKGVGTLNVTWRSDAVQAGYFKFMTTIPGKVTVKFSDTGGTAGGDRAPRYANVNGTRSDVSSNGSSGGVVTSSAIPVDAGEVIIKGEQYNSSGDNYTDNQIRVFEIVFTAMPEEVSGTITASGYNTYSSNYPLDLSTISGGTAYIATDVTDGKVVLTKCTDKVAAGTGLFIAGTADKTFTIGTSAETTAALAANLLVGMPNGGEVAKATEGYNYVFGWTDASNPGFYLINESVATLANFKAYLHTSDALTENAARLSFVFENEANGIALVKNEKQNVEGATYNLNGQRVIQPIKGLYIVNGKKVIIK